MTTGLIAIACGIAILGVIGAGLGLGIASSKASESVARNPEASGKIMSTGLIFATLSEVTAIFAFVISIILVGNLS